MLPLHCVLVSDKNGDGFVWPVAQTAFLNESGDENEVHPS
jgi:hypothetical protein